MSLSPLAEKFFTSEYTQLREETRQYAKVLEDNERNALIVNGALWSWIIIQKQESAYLILLFAFKAIMAHRAINHISIYIRKVEKLFELPQGHGWEEHRFDSKKIKFVRSIIFWNTLVFGNIFCGIIVFFIKNT